jgi:DNA-directed RNA polymerase specialized sigma24 family protein
MASGYNGTRGDSAGLDDEDMVQLAQQGNFGQAWEELRRRTEVWLVPFVRALAWHLRIPKADFPDALQQAALAIEETLRRVCQSRAEGRNECALSTLLHLVVKCRIKDFAKSLRRARQPYDRNKDALATLADCEGHRSRAAEADPAGHLIRQENALRLRQAVAQLSEKPRRVAEGVLADKTIADIALELGDSYIRIWRLWQETKELLRSQLPDLADGDAG